MKKQVRRDICISIGLLLLFGCWTAAVRFIDVRPIGPRGSTVGFAAVNQWMHTLTGVHMTLYALTDWLSLVPLLLVMGFGILGLVQWLQRRQLCKVDHSLLALGGYYILVLMVYVLFETVVINYRPVLLNDILEPSYPSSTTMLVLCVMPTAAMQLQSRIRHRVLKGWLTGTIMAFTVLMVVCRFLSGVHWFTDIVGGIFLSAGLTALYRAILHRTGR